MSVSREEKTKRKLLRLSKPNSPTQKKTPSPSGTINSEKPKVIPTKDWYVVWVKNPKKLTYFGPGHFSKTQSEIYIQSLPKEHQPFCVPATIKDLLENNIGNDIPTELEGISNRAIKGTPLFPLNFPKQYKSKANNGKLRAGKWRSQKLIRYKFYCLYFKGYKELGEEMFPTLCPTNLAFKCHFILKEWSLRNQESAFKKRKTK